MIDSKTLVKDNYHAAKRYRLHQMEPYPSTMLFITAMAERSFATDGLCTHEQAPLGNGVETNLSE